MQKKKNLSLALVDRHESVDEADKGDLAYSCLRILGREST